VLEFWCDLLGWRDMVSVRGGYERGVFRPPYAWTYATDMTMV
jgi:hypothetical protein